MTEEKEGGTNSSPPQDEGEESKAPPAVPLLEALRRLADPTRLEANRRFEEMRKAREEAKEANRKANRWINTALYLYIHTSECQTCGHRESWSNPTILLEKTHPRLGRHLTALPNLGHDPEQDYPGLPQRIEYVEHQLDACMVCWGITQVVNQARKEAREEEENQPIHPNPEPTPDA